MNGVVHEALFHLQTFNLLLMLLTPLLLLLNPLLKTVKP